jgi:hypothetical protein
MPKITEELICSAKTTKGAWNKAQFALIGIAWPPPKGWKSSIIGKEISEEHAANFIALGQPKTSSNNHGQ